MKNWFYIIWFAVGSILLMGCGEEKPTSSTEETTVGDDVRPKRHFTKTNLKLPENSDFPELAELTQGDEFLIDRSNSKMAWVGNSAMGEQRGEVKISEGVFLYGIDDQYQGRLVIDMSKITSTTTENKKDEDKLLADLKGPNFFNVDEYPYATAQIMMLNPGEGNNRNGEILLKIKDMVHPTQFDCTMDEQGDSLIVNGNFSFDRTLYDIRYRSETFYKNIGDKAISNDVIIDFQLKFFLNRD